MSRISQVRIHVTCFLLFPLFLAFGMHQVSSAEAQQPLTSLQAAELVLADAQVMVEEASDPQRSVSDAVRLVEEAVGTAQTAAQMVQTVVGRTREELLSAQDIRRRVRVFDEALRLVYETRYATRVSHEMADLRARIATLRPECGLPGFAADWHFNFAEIDRRLEQLRRGEGDSESLRKGIDGQVEALHISVQAHASYSADLCSLYDARRTDISDQASSILLGESLRDVIFEFEREQKKARVIPANACSLQGYLRVIPSWSSIGEPLLGNAAPAPPTTWTANGIAFVRDHLKVGDDGLAVEIPRTTTHTTRDDVDYTCRNNRLLVTTVEEHVLGRGNYAVALQYGRLGENSPYYGKSDTSAVELYLVGVRDAIYRQADADIESRFGEPSAHQAEYNRRFARLDWIGKRMEQDLRVVRMMAGDIQGDDRQNYLRLFSQHSATYDALEQARMTAAAQLQIAREANEARLQQAKQMAAAQVEAARLSANAMVQAAKEQASARRFNAVVGGISGVLGRFVPMTATTTILRGAAPN